MVRLSVKVKQSQEKENAQKFLSAMLNSQPAESLPIPGNSGKSVDIKCDMATKIIESHFFRNFFISMIILNSLVLALPDYSCVDGTGQLTISGSWRNAIFMNTEELFLSLFTVEIVLKIFGMGLFSMSSYFMDNWNILDFIVIMIGWIAFGVHTRNKFVTIVRLVRVFRPLKALATSESLKKVITVVLSSIPRLANILAIASFMYIFFAIVGLQLFSGPYMHTRCRLTPYPVNMNWTDGDNVELFRCLQADNVDDIGTKSGMTKASSPWSNPMDNCWWPVDEEDPRFCSFGSDGMHPCVHDIESIPRDQWRWCGSDLDGYGNVRFSNNLLLNTDSSNDHTFWGHVNFDNFFRSLLTVFEIVLLSNWAEIMYLMQDAFGGWIAIYTILAVVVGNFVTLNLILTSINSTVEEYNKDRQKKEAEKDLISQTTNEEESPILSTELVSSKSSPFATFFSIMKEQVGLASTIILDFHLAVLAPIMSIVEHRVFRMATAGLIVANTLLLCIDHYPSDPAFSNRLEIGYFIIIILFTFELTLKVLGRGLRVYFSAAVNLLDFVVVIISFSFACAEPPVFTLHPTHAQLRHNKIGTTFSALRSLRILQLLMLIGAFKGLQDFSDRIKKTIYDLLAFVLIFLIFLYIMALIGLQSFANLLRFDESGLPISITDYTAWQNAPERPRSNFDDFALSFITVFQIMTGSGWFDVMDSVWRAQGPVAAAFPIVVVVIGNFILLNQLLTFLIDDLTGDDAGEDTLRALEVLQADEGVDEQTKESFKYIEQLADFSMTDLTGYDTEYGQDHSIVVKALGDGDEMDPMRRTIDIDIDRATGGTSVRAMPPPPLELSNVFEFFQSIQESSLFQSVSVVAIILSTVLLALDNPLYDPNTLNMRVALVMNFVLSIYFVVENGIEILAKTPIVYFQSEWHVGDLFITLVSIIGVAISNPALKALRVFKVLRCLRVLQIFQVFSQMKNILEAMVGVIPRATFVFGLLMAMLVMFAIFTVSTLKGQLRACQGVVYDEVLQVSESYATLLNYPHAWGALNSIQRGHFGPENAVFEEYNMTNVAMEVCGQAWPYAPCCYNSAQSSVYVGNPLEPNSRSFCECWGGDWLPTTDFRFDNLAYAILTLFMTTTLENWTNLMYQVIDCRGMDMQPMRDHNKAWILFFIVFITATNFLCLNLFIAEVIKSFQDHMPLKSDAEANEFAKPADDPPLLWIELFLTGGMHEELKVDASRRILEQWTPLDHSQMEDLSKFNPIIAFAKTLERNAWFESGMIAVIFANTITLGMVFFGESDNYRASLDACNFAFGVLFNVELIVKLLANGYLYFYEAANIFDAVVVLSTDIEMIVAAVYGSSAAKLVTIGRMLRIVKAARVMKTPQLHKFIQAITSVLPSLLNIAVFILVALLVYAVVGVQAFGKIAYNDIYDEQANFRSFPTALLTMFRFTTGASWNDYVYAASYHTPGCVVNPPFNASYCGFHDYEGCIPLNGCGDVGIFPFLLSFIVIVNFVCISLFVAGVITALDGFNEQTFFDKHDPLLRGKFARLWGKYDPEKTGFVSVDNLEAICSCEENPFKTFVAPHLVEPSVEVMQSVKPGGQEGGSAALPELATCTSVKDLASKLPLAVKLGYGCLLCDVAKILILAQNPRLVELSGDFTMNLDKVSVQGRQWLSLREYYAAKLISRWCDIRQRIVIKSRNVRKMILKRAWSAWRHASKTGETAFLGDLELAKFTRSPSNMLIGISDAVDYGVKFVIDDMARLQEAMVSLGLSKTMQF